MKFLFSLFIFSEVWVIIRELIKFEHKFIKNLLLSIESVKIFKELLSNGTGPNATLLSLKPYISENSLHLTLVVGHKALPKLNDDWLEVVVYVIAFW